MEGKKKGSEGEREGGVSKAYINRIYGVKIKKEN